MKVSEAVTTRHSVRAFTDKEVSRDVLERILEKARWSPSGGNLQPWWVHVVGGKKLIELTELVALKMPDTPAGEGGDYNCLPT